MAKSSTPHQASWTAEEIGFLAGGPGRAAEVALARLMDGGLVRFSREGLVTAVHQNGYGATTPLEAHILAGLGGVGRPVGLVVGPTANSHEMGALRRSLVDRAVVRRQWGRARGGVVALRVLLVLLGIAFLAAGLFADRNLLAVTIVAWFVAFLMRDKKMLTPIGRGVLGHARRNPRGRVDAVALHGLRAGMGIAPMRHHHGRRKSRSDGGGCGSGCSSSYDHGCGSSSCSSSSCSSSSCSSNSCNSSSSCSSSSSSCSSSSCSSSSSSCSSSSS
ncbi:TIGR04222 domain-containing membrane protein [Lentzea flava]|uniref:TIGR04222 domain-containing protein n=1 Tax=Lentzea flava TaxID=103732 RepID=A0ABQ2V499_9PSEU|nr:TIGR04222 domain-containing membrane protein [Lentzea flava]MCP2203377.1 TIGR04222 domain-containing protein [Lentzea flava]GGU68361.1 hypothetical protein GCM10010178_70230 [Lentzea flava]